MSLLLAALLASPAVFTSTADVHACQPLTDGRVLAATSGGLVLYGPDLETERIWTSFDALPGTDVRALTVSRDGTAVWVGGEDGVAVLHRTGQEAWALRRVASVRSVGALIATGDGRLLVGAAGGLVVLDAERGVELARHELPRDRARGPRQFVTSLAGGRARLHLGTSGAGLWTWNGSDLRPSSAELPSPYVHALAAADGRVLAGTVGGLVQIGRAAPVSTAEVRALLRVEGGWLAGTMGEGLRRLDEVTGVEAPVAFPALHVTALGREGETTCVGTTEGMFVRRAPHDAWRRARVTGPPSNDISALALDGERLWVGTFDRGLAWLENGRWTMVSGIDERVNGLAVERHAEGSRLWVATARGLASVENGRVRVRRHADGLPADDVHAVTALHGGGVLAGTARGAAIVRGSRVETLVKTGAPAEATWAVGQGAGGSLWLGTTNGLYRYRAGAPVRRFSVAGGHLWDNWVTSIAVEDTSIWVGTYAGGVSRLAFGARDAVSAEPWAGNAHVNPAGLSLFQGRLWAATMEGLMYFQPTGGDGAWRVAGGDAPGRDVTAMVHDRRWRWVASRSGLARWPVAQP
jgi:ligand-binding sensor domain-containing protein